ncbi:transposase [Streptomyces sp. NPDC052040]|uniref:transposase n=1 Tax=Streptomyces sp. NPDC052040 TaxID=3365682 RepID=UPI0037CD3B42
MRPEIPSPAHRRRREWTLAHDPCRPARPATGPRPGTSGRSRSVPSGHPASAAPARPGAAGAARSSGPCAPPPPRRAALERFAEFAHARGREYLAVVRFWEHTWVGVPPSGGEFPLFPRFAHEIRGIVCTHDAIEAVNARIRRAVKARGHFPNETAALNCVCMAIMSFTPHRHGSRTLSVRDG